MFEKPSILVADGNRAVCAELRKYLEGIGARTEVAEVLEDAIARLRRSPVDLIVAGVGSFDGEGLCRKAKEIQPRAAVLLVYPPDDEYPDRRAVASGADAYLLGPLKRANVLSMTRVLLKLGLVSRQIADLQVEAEDGLVSPAARTVPSIRVDFEFFKHLAIMEVKRSKRYHYPLACLLVAVDNLRASTFGMDKRTRTEFMGRLLKLLSRGLRDVDLCILYSEEKFLVFLPHTGRAGARKLAERLRAQVVLHPDGPAVTVSVGLAAFDGVARGVTLASLLRESAANLDSAKRRGGDCVDSGETAPSAPHSG